jgi:DNA-binding transcriptional LysR family regulator
VSRSSLTAGIDDLERALGHTLCIRTKATGAELTAVGERVLAAGESLLETAKELEQNGRSDGPASVLSIACFPSLAATVMAHAWSEVNRRYPGVELKVVSLNRDEIIETVLSGRADYGLAYNLQAVPELATSTLYDTQMRVILMAGHPLAAHELVPRPHRECACLAWNPSKPRSSAVCGSVVGRRSSLPGCVS